METANGIAVETEEVKKAADETEWVESTAMPDAPSLPPPEVPEVVAAPKKRGRKPYPRDANGNIIRPDGTVAKSQRPRAQTQAVTQQETISDDDIGKAISGAFMLTAIPLGPHWRLFPHETKELGHAFGPLARKYPDAVKEWIPYLMLAPAVASVVLPRIMVQSMLAKHELQRTDARKAILQALVLMKAEEKLDLERQAKEAEEFLRRMSAMPESPNPVNAATSNNVQ